MRTKVAALLVSLAALWAFAAWVTLRDGANLLWVATLDSGVATPGDPLVIELQRERRLSLIHLGARGPADEQALRAQRAETDAAAAAFIEQAGSSSVALAASDTLDLRLDQVFARLEGLKEVRAALDAGVLDRVRAAGTYTGVIDTIYRAYDSLAIVDDEETVRDAGTLIEMSRAVELLSQEDALVAGALAAGGLSVAERGRFAQLVGAQRFARAEAAAELPAADRRGYDAFVAGSAFSALRDLEDHLIQGTAPVGPEQWRSTIEPVLVALDATVRKAAADLVERAGPVALGVIVRLVLAGGLGLIAVIASIVVSVTTTGAILAQLKKLRDAAHELSERRLPRVVERVGRGEEVDLAVDAPPLEFGDDEIGEVGRAFNSVQETAIRVAAEQAELRRNIRGIRDILLSLARRTQGLVHRQLTVLDVMERREHKPEELRDLFKLDHLATRMRRNAENLIVLSGSSPGRTWRRSVPMIDVVRGALAEVEDYTRVQLQPVGEATLAGKAVGDVVHLLAELIENAVSFSPPYTMVRVSGQMAVNGYVIEIEDRGLGMTREDMEAANRRIAEPPEFRLTDTARLGLYVVARLAERHDIRVRLRPSPYDGTTVVVVVPLQLIGLEPEAEAPMPAVEDARFALLEDFGREGRDVREDDLVPGIPAPRSAPNGPPGGTALALRSVPVTEQPVVRGPRPPLPTRSVPADAHPLTSVDPVLSEKEALRTASPHGDVAPGRAAGDAADSEDAPARSDVGLAREFPDPANAHEPAARQETEVPRSPVSPEADAGVSVASPEAGARVVLASAEADAGVVLASVEAGAQVVPASQETGARPVPASRETVVEQARPAFTPSGLPFRVPQANLAPGLMTEEDTTPQEQEDDERSPEEIRAIMGSFQSGTRLGRTQAAKLTEGET
ncbi:nitrate- and nitrite sensing domain-containing protein [Nonomuraea sp. NPDC049152]|uniref:sensor histidine kinase n=1 Tax=Nonomuraea sp. NPDC049152 TaxID=3154350 RepID=UPI0033EFE125